MTEEHKDIKDFTGKGKIRLFGRGNQIKSLIAVGLLTVAALIPGKANAEPHHAKTVRRVTDAAMVVSGVANILGNIAENQALKAEMAKLQAQAALIDQGYQAQIAGLNAEFESFVKKGGRTDQAIASAIKYYKAKNDYRDAGKKGNLEGIKIFEGRFRAEIKKVQRLDPHVFHYTDHFTEEQNGYYNLEMIKRELIGNKRNFAGMHLNDCEIEAVKATQARDAEYAKLNAIARQYQTQITWNNLDSLGTGVFILGPAVDMFSKQYPGYAPKHPGRSPKHSGHPLNSESPKLPPLHGRGY